MREQINLDEALGELGQLASERSAKWETVLLMGDKETILPQGLTRPEHWVRVS